jgi:hypothetical protein
MTSEHPEDPPTGGLSDLELLLTCVDNRGHRLEALLEGHTQSGPVDGVGFVIAGCLCCDVRLVLLDADHFLDTLVAAGYPEEDNESGVDQ